MVKIDSCEVCGNRTLRSVLDLGNHPMCDDLVAVGDPRHPNLYPINILYCTECNTAHQAYQVPKQQLFPDTYHYRARNTADVLSGMRQLVARCEAQVSSLQGLRVIDIGCNDGSLLSIFAAKGAMTFGIEPTGAADDAKSAGHSIIKEFLTPELAKDFVTANGQPDIITFTNVFAHIEDLKSVLVAVRTLMGPRTLLVIENHYLGSVLDRYQFDTFYHEHPRTYSLTSFQRIAKSLEAYLVAAEFPARYGGNIRVMIKAGIESGRNTEAIENLAAESLFEQRLVRMAAGIPHWKMAKREEISNTVARYGPIRGKAFPGRAAILVKLLELDTSLISEVYEKPESKKIGHYMPGTRIQIVSDSDFDFSTPMKTPILNLAWHISNEIRGYMSKSGFAGPIIDIFSPEEFEKLL